MCFKMSPKQAKKELSKIMNQKTVSISRLKKVLEVLDYELLEKQYINASFRIITQKNRLRQLESEYNENQ